MDSLYKVNYDWYVVANNISEAITKYNKYIEEYPKRGSIIKNIEVISNTVIN